MIGGKPAPTLERRGAFGDRCVIALSGEWDLYNRPELASALITTIDEGERRLVLDLTAATFIDSSILGALIEARKRVRPEGGEIVVVADTPEIRRVFEITGFENVFSLYERLDDLR